MKNIKIFENEIKIGGYALPADFKYINKVLLSELNGLDFTERFNKIFCYLTDTEKNYEFLNLKNEGCSTEINVLDDALAVVELNSGENLIYTDYVFNTENLFTKVCSLISVVASIYVDLVNLGVISQGEKINFAFNGNNGLLALSLLIAKASGIPINTVISGSLYRGKCNVNGLFNATVNDKDVLDYIEDFFYDYDYPFDTYSALGMCAEDEYHAEFDDDTFTVILSLASPYLDARKVLKAVSGKNELSVDKAINKLYTETAIEVPENIKNGKVKPFLNYNIDITFEEAIEIIKMMKI